MISIIIPTYNKAKMLEITLQSILVPSLLDVEIIIIDDASSDDTANTIKLINNEKIKYYTNTHNIGTVQSRIKGLKKASGNYVVFFDDDDVWFPSKLEQQLAKIKKGDLDFVMSYYMVNNTIDNIKYVKKLRGFEKNFVSNIVAGPGPFFQCCLFRASFIKDKIALLDSRAEPFEDWDFFLSISQNNMAVGIVRQVLFQWNLTKKSQSRNYTKETCAIQYIISKHKQHIIKRCSWAVLSRHYRILGCRFYYVKDFNQSSYYYKKAFRAWPYSIKNILYIIINLLPETIRKVFLQRLVKKIV